MLYTVKQVVVRLSGRWALCPAVYTSLSLHLIPLQHPPACIKQPHWGFEGISLDVCVQMSLYPIDVWGFVNMPQPPILPDPASADITPPTVTSTRCLRAVNRTSAVIDEDFFPCASSATISRTTLPPSKRFICHGIPGSKDIPNAVHFL